MSPPEAHHRPGERLGDVIRAVASLGGEGARGLDADELDLLARLMPAPERRPLDASSAAPPPAVISPQAPVRTATGLADRPDAGRRPRGSARLATAARGRARAWIALAEDLAERIARMRRRWLAVPIAAVALLAGLRLGGVVPAWLPVAIAAGALLAGIALGVTQLRAWRRSPLLRSSASTRAPGEDREGGRRDGPPARLVSARYVPPPRAEPIVERRRGRALALGLAAVDVPGALDVRRLVEDVARGRPAREPPRLVRRSLRRGVQLLVDRGPALDPLRDDVALLVSWLLDVASPAGLQQLGFRGDPRRVTGARRPGADPDEPLDYRTLLPRTHSAVVVVCDLGIGRPRSGPPPPGPAAWLAHDRLVRQAGCRAVYLVPYAPQRWPPALAARLAIVHWRENLRLDELLAPAPRRRPAGPASASEPARPRRPPATLREAPR